MFSGVLDSSRQVIIFEASIRFSFQTMSVRISFPQSTEPLSMSSPVELPCPNVRVRNQVLVSSQLEILDGDLLSNEGGELRRAIRSNLARVSALKQLRERVCCPFSILR